MNKMMVLSLLAGLAVSTAYAMDAGAGSSISKTAERIRLENLLFREFGEESDPADFRGGDFEFYFCEPKNDFLYVQVATADDAEVFLLKFSTSMNPFPDSFPIEKTSQEGWAKMTKEEAGEWHRSVAATSSPVEVMSTQRTAHKSPVSFSEFLDHMGDGEWWQITGHAEEGTHVGLQVNSERDGDKCVFLIGKMKNDLKGKDRYFFLGGIDIEKRVLRFDSVDVASQPLKQPDRKKDRVVYQMDKLLSDGSLARFIKLRSAAITRK